MISLLLAFACNENELIVDGSYEGSSPDDTAAVDDQAALDAEWDGARLVVEAPISGSFLPFEESAEFQAVVYAADGTVKDFPDITWASDVDEDWALMGASATDATLGVGTHALTAEALLPNGDRLAYTVGGVLVQSPYAGVYVGDLAVTAAGDYNGQTLSVGCSGALTMVVDAEGDVATGDAGCLLSLLGYDIDTAYIFDLENDDGDLAGTASIDLQFYELPVDTTGTITEDGELEGDFSAEVAGYLTMEASYAATRITRDLSTVEN
ncbi:hypothetical protein LBMAG42_53560 [Deltaproteobacteria bacterium]|nr:hypothetical protein LBMAG42_53560 [Deltaproteobacteria bacterium]